MKRLPCLALLLAACGGSDDATPDAYIPSGPDYDLSCLTNIATTVPDPIVLDAQLLDHTYLSSLTPVASAEIRSYRLGDGALISTNTTDADGRTSISLATGGTPSRMNYDFEATGQVKGRVTVTIPPWKSGPTILPSVTQGRLDALATALGTTLDPTKATLEVWLLDCSRPELKDATIAVSGEPDAPWAMFTGTGQWLPRATTIARPVANLGTGSMAATPNVSPGTHDVMVTGPGGLALGPYPITVEAGRWTVLVLVPGVPTDR
jgi:hypothetical protein